MSVGGLERNDMKNLLLAGWLIVLASTVLAATTNEIQQLVADLGADRFATRESAQRQLLAIGAPAAAFLQNAANSNDPEVRTRALDILAQIGEGDTENPDPKIFAEVETLLQPVMGSSHENLNILVQMGKRATPALIAIATGSDNRKSIYAMIALTRAADPRCFPALAQLFQTDDISRHMTGYVSQIKNPQMLGELIKLWNKLGDEASDKLRAQVKKMSQQELGDDPAAYRKWFQEQHPETIPSNK